MKLQGLQHNISKIKAIHLIHDKRWDKKKAIWILPIGFQLASSPTVTHALKHSSSTPNFQPGKDVHGNIYLQF